MRRMLAVALAVAATVSCTESEAEREARAMKEAVPVRLQADGAIRLTDAEQKAVGLVVTPARKETMTTTVRRLGVVLARPEDEGVLVMPVLGRVDKAPDVQVGQALKPGDLVANVAPILGAADQTSIASQRGGLEGQIAAAAAELTTTETEFARGQRLQAQSLLSAQELLRLETSVSAARSRLAGLRSTRDALTSGPLARTALRAPIAGTLAVLDTAAGLTLPAGHLVARIVASGPRWVDLAVPSAETTGASYVVELPGTADVAPGKLVARGIVVEADGMRRDRLEVPPNGVAPGSVVLVRVVRESADRVVVAADAVLAIGTAHRVYVRTSAERFEPRSVRVLERSAGKVALDGITDGDAVVVRGGAALLGESLRSELRHQE